MTAEPPTWRALQAEAVDGLRAAGVESPESDARRMVEEASGCSGTELVLALDDVAVERAAARLRSMVDRRSVGEPLQYVLGSWGFRHLDLMVDRRVLIPRPETESVVDAVLGEIDRIAAARTPVTVVDLGTGSGAIALAVASERTGTRVWATDVSEDALVVARGNLAGLGRAAARVRIAAGSWFEALPSTLRGGIDVVASNPPYVDPAVPLPAEVHDWEPHRALYSAAAGTADLRRIIAEAPEWLRPDGALVCEYSPEQTTELSEWAAERFTEVAVVVDLAGRERALVARAPRR